MPLNVLPAREDVAADGGLRGWLCENRGMEGSLPRVRIDLWRADAIVLFDWLMSVDLDSVPVEHRAEKQALADLLTRLEVETDIPGVSQGEIDAARAEVSRDMGW
jgi:hypothetical protein